jgi:hypothetical protein
MKNSKHISDEHAVLVAAKLQQAVEEKREKDAQEIADFYIKYYDYVELVVCGSCKQPLCLWVLEPGEVKANLGAHPSGLRRIVLGMEDGALLSSRKRSDGSMGYRCRCGADTIHNEAEKQVIAEKGWPGVIPSSDPHIMHEIHKKSMAISFKPTIRKLKKNIVAVDGFVHTTLKNTLEENN